MDFPKDLRYTKDHEWARIEGNAATVGITAFAVEQLGDITLVELPKVGATVTQGKALGTVESVKTVSDLYAPMSGKVASVNTALENAPEKVNESPYGDGWMVKIELSAPAETKGLLDVAAYQTHVASQDH